MKIKRYQKPIFIFKYTYKKNNFFRLKTKYKNIPRTRET